MQEEARQWTDDRLQMAIRRHDILPDAPEDLADREPRFSLARDGRRVSSYLIVTDFLHGRASPVSLWVFAAIMATLGGAAATGTGVMSSYLLLLGLMAVCMWFIRHDSLARAIDSAHTGESSVLGTAKSHAQIRISQARRAKNDPTPVFTLGRSTGSMSSMGDWLAADSGRAMGLSQSDLSTHLFYLGSTGTGKTSAGLRPLAHHWAAQTEAGMLIIDGKGDLPRELDGLRDYELIEPTRSAVALLGRLEPHDVVLALRPPGQKQDDFWVSSAGTLLYNACVLVHRGAQLQLNGIEWTISGVRQLLTDVQFRAQTATALNDSLGDHPSQSMESALNYFAFEFVNLPENTMGGILATALSWLSPLAEHDSLANWCMATADQGAVDITEVLRGARYGLDVPAFKYGTAATAVASLLRAQVYRASKVRGSRPHWGPDDKDCLLMIDEAALALGEQENEILPIARSLGLSFCCACQNIDQLMARFGDAGAGALLDQFRSLVMFQTSPKTYEYVRSRAGTAVVGRPQPKDAPALAPMSRLEAGGRHRSASFRFLSYLATRAVGLLQKDTSTLSWSIQCPLPEQAEHLPQMSAVALLNRAGAPRREIMHCSPLFFEGGSANVKG